MKIHMKKLLTLLFAFTLLGASCNKPVKPEKSPESKPQTGGSCNRIKVEGEGYCIDYIGAKSSLAAPCSSQYYSPDSCPPSSIGGCKLNSGTDKEKVIWSYDYGGYPTYSSQIQNELIPSCNAQGGQWTDL